VKQSAHEDKERDASEAPPYLVIKHAVANCVQQLLDRVHGAVAEEVRLGTLHDLKATAIRYSQNTQRSKPPKPGKGCVGGGSGSRRRKRRKKRKKKKKKKKKKERKKEPDDRGGGEGDDTMRTTLAVITAF
jgi:hypothetical protein